MNQTLKPLIALLIISFFMNDLVAQKKLTDQPNETFNKAYIGVGFGLDYGGIGIKAEFLPTKYVSFFGGAGYNLVDPAYNVGLSAKILPDQMVCPFIIGMYGYNAALKVSGPFLGERERKTYYGLSMGAGIDIRSRGSNNKISLAILIPFRDPDFQKTFDEYERLGYKFNQKPWPIAISIGFNFAGRKG